MKSLTCSRCGEEVRHGARGAVLGWLHREERDHAVILGFIASDEVKADWEAQRLIPRFRISSAAANRCPTYQDLWPLEEYTTAEQDILRDNDSPRRKRRLAEFRGIDIDTPVPIPPVEIPCRPASIEEFAPRSGIRQIVNLIDRIEGWERVRLTRSRGPYLGASGEVLSISDSVVLGARGPGVDGKPNETRVVVASWRDDSFDFAYAGILDGSTVRTRPVNSNALKAWIRGEGDLQV